MEYSREESFLDREKESRRLKRELKKQKEKKRRKWDDDSYRENQELFQYK